MIENRGGAGGNVGAQAVAQSAPDGYTILLAGVTKLHSRCWPAWYEARKGQVRRRTGGDGDHGASRSPDKAGAAIRASAIRCCERAAHRENTFAFQRQMNGG